MPRYLFNLYDDVVALDDEGAELADVETARRHAITGIRELVADDAKRGRINLSHHVEVTDEHQVLLLSIAYSDAVEVTTG